jgi:hypothetical protein
MADASFRYWKECRMDCNSYAFCSYVVLSNGLIICVRCTNNDIATLAVPMVVLICSMYIPS